MKTYIKTYMTQMKAEVKENTSGSEIGLYGVCKISPLNHLISLSVPNKRLLMTYWWE